MWLRTVTGEARDRRGTAERRGRSCGRSRARTSLGRARASGVRAASSKRPDVTRSRRCSGESSGSLRSSAEPDHDALGHVLDRAGWSRGTPVCRPRRSARRDGRSRGSPGTGSSGRRSRWNHRKCAGGRDRPSRSARPSAYTKRPAGGTRHVDVRRKLVPQPRSHGRPGRRPRGNPIGRPHPGGAQSVALRKW